MKTDNITIEQVEEAVKQVKKEMTDSKWDNHGYVRELIAEAFESFLECIKKNNCQ